jgi:uncharacterized protein YciI
MESRVRTMKKGTKLYISIDYPAGEMEHHEDGENDYQNVVTYMNQVAKERFYVGGTIPNIKGAMIVFEAENYEEAEKVARMKDCPFVTKGYYRRELYEWNIVISSEGAAV